MTVQKIQIIRRKINPNKFMGNSSDAYYKSIRYDLTRKINGDAEIVLIEFDPKTPISERFIVKTLMNLQREFTDILISPKNSVKLNSEEIEDIKNRFKASMVLDSV